MKHANADMTKAVLDNTELAIFCEVVDDENGNYWAVSNLSSLVSCTNKFFVCLPQHKETCLHWLNGGDVQVRSRMSCGESFGDWDGLCPLVEQDSTWKKTSHFMSRWFEIRIKPKKEKRWIVWDLDKDRYHCTFKKNPEGNYLANFNFQILEVEVECNG